MEHERFGLFASESTVKADELLEGRPFVGLVIIWLGPETKGQPLPA